MYLEERMMENLCGKKKAHYRWPRKKEKRFHDNFVRKEGIKKEI